LPQLGTEGKVK